jgi:Protein of unknown function (DUF2917)
MSQLDFSFIRNDSLENPVKVQLSGSQILSINRPRGISLNVESGCVWVTIDGDTQDYQLNQGQSMKFESTPRVIVTTLGGTALVSANESACVEHASNVRHWGSVLKRRRENLDVSTA